MASRGGRVIFPYGADARSIEKLIRWFTNHENMDMKWWPRWVIKKEREREDIQSCSVECEIREDFGQMKGNMIKIHCIHV